MADGGNSYRYSAETRALLVQHAKFFDSLDKLITGDGTLDLKFLGGDDEARSEREFTEDGNVKITFIFPLDTSADSTASDGRIYLKDEFIFDPRQEKLKHFQRRFEYNQKGDVSFWSPKLKALEEGATFKSFTDEDKKNVKAYAMQVGRAYSRPMTSAIKDAWRQQVEYLSGIGNAAISVRPDWALFPNAPESHYKLIYNQDTLEVVLSFVVDNDKDPKNGRIFVNDRFVLDRKTQQFQSVNRYWTVGRDSRKVPEMKELLEAMKAAPGPQSAEAEPFIKAMLPILLEPGIVGGIGGKVPPLDVNSVIQPPKPDLVKPSIWSPFNRGKHLEGEAKDQWLAGQRENLALLRSVASEAWEQRDDRSKGWVTGFYNSKFDLGKRKESLDQLVAKAGAALQPGKDAWRTLQELPLEGELKEIRDLLVRDPLLQQAALAAVEPDAAMRSTQLLVFARESLAKGRHMNQSALALAQAAKADPMTAAGASQLVDFLKGGGSTATKFEMLTPAFVDEVVNPKTLAAMALAGPIGSMAESGALYFGRYSVMLDHAARIAGIGAEAVAFAGAHRTFNALSHSSANFWKDFHFEVASMGMMFGAMRVAHFVGAEARIAMGDGKWGRLLGSRASAVEESLLQTTAAGRIRLPLHITEAGAMAPELTRLGMTVSGTLNHVGGIAAVYGSNKGARLFSPASAVHQPLGNEIFDAILGYTQAVAGVRIGNRLTDGMLLRGTAEARLRTEALRNERKGMRRSVPTITATGQSIPERQPGEAVFHFRAGKDVLSVEARTGIKRIHFGRGSEDVSRVVYPDSDVAQIELPANDPTLSTNHAVIERDKSGIFRIGDQGSEYGTFVNDVQVKPGAEPVQLRSNDRIRIGDNIEFVLDVEGDLITKVTKAKSIIPVVRQDQPPPPQAVSEFPFETYFNDPAIPDDPVPVARLSDANGLNESLYSNKVQWTLPTAIDGKVAAELYIDGKGRFFLVKEYVGPNSADIPVSVNGRVIPKWSFLQDTDAVNIGGRDFRFQQTNQAELLDDAEAITPLPAPPPLPPPSVKPSQASLSTQIGEALEEYEEDAAELVEDAEPIELVDIKRPSSTPPAQAAPVVDPKGPATRFLFDEPDESEFDEDRETIPGGLPAHYSRRSDPPPPPQPQSRVQSLSSDAAREFDDAITQNRAVTSDGSQEATSSSSPKVRSDKTHPGGYRMQPNIATYMPPDTLAGLDPGDAPMILLYGGFSFPADRVHTSIVLGSNPELNPNKPWQKALELKQWANIQGTHAEIAIDESGDWWVYDRLTETGTFVDEGNKRPRRLNPNEWVKLDEDHVIFLGEPGKPESLEVQFTRKGGFRDRQPTLNDQTGIIEAAEFPVALLGSIPADHPIAMFHTTASGVSKTFNAERNRTGYTIGSRPSVSSKESGVLVVPSEALSPDHARFFITNPGVWAIQDLDSENGTYVNGERLEPLEKRLLATGDSIALGDPHGVSGALIKFEHPTYLTWDEVQAKRNAAQDSGDMIADDDIVETVDDRPSQAPTIAPPSPFPPPMVPSGPPVPRSRPKAPPLPPRGRATPPPLPTQAQAKTTAPAPAAEPFPTSPSAPAAQILPPSSPPDSVEDFFGDLNEEVGLTTPNQSSSKPPAPPAAPVARDSSADPFAAALTRAVESAQASQPPSLPPAPPAAEVPVVETPSSPPVDPKATLKYQEDDPHGSFAKEGNNLDTKVFRIESASQPEIQTLGLDMSSIPTLGQLDPFLIGDRNKFSEALRGLKVYPKIEPSPSNVVTDSSNFWGLFDSLIRRAENALPDRNPVRYTDAEKETIMGLFPKYFLEGKIPHAMAIESDARSLRFTIPADGSVKFDTLVSIHLHNNVGIGHLEPVLKHFMTLPIPIEVILPMRVSDSAHLGIFVRAEDFSKVYEAVLQYVGEHPGQLNPNPMPFSHAVLTPGEKRTLPGVGVMENFTAGTWDPLMYRARAMTEAYNKYIKDLNATQGSFDRVQFLKMILDRFADRKLSISDYGFRGDNIYESHAAVGLHSAPRQVNRLVLEALTKKQ